MTKHIIIDIETLGQKPGCVVLEAAAVVLNKGDITHKYQFSFDVNDQIDHGLSIDLETASWWQKIYPETYAAIVKDADKFTPDNVFNCHNIICSHNNKGRTHIWANGTSFDFPILSAFFAAYKLDLPWHYRDERDLRTYLALKNKRLQEYMVAGTVPHRAINDAIAGAEFLKYHPI